MSYFSRLTDIVTCNLTHLLNNAADPVKEIEQIISEMKEGIAGAHRSVKTATSNERALQEELQEHQKQISQWKAAAKSALETGDEPEARNSLVRKREIEDLMAGLEQQHQASVATCEHLTTTLYALEARLAEAKRKQLEISEKSSLSESSPQDVAEMASDKSALSPTRSEQIESDLAALKRELSE
ncbi:MAG: PspA/IM30 family protein [Planctomycetes bacterium]|nr:PspA/IM30 family protein [Planctomycetota bacterium]MCH9725184.1 PspA/IM30 family protein [Planctomycetota bacterium]MCH9776594.1 PspA/IM30 family protein [Planctomycetota bacterium]MCH9789680.1 PspA/IM30 family protein [Planctomycetota bacterium]